MIQRKTDFRNGDGLLKYLLFKKEKKAVSFMEFSSEFKMIIMESR